MCCAENSFFFCMIKNQILFSAATTFLTSSSQLFRIGANVNITDCIQVEQAMHHQKPTIESTLTQVFLITLFTSLSQSFLIRANVYFVYQSYMLHTTKDLQQQVHHFTRHTSTITYVLHNT